MRSKITMIFVALCFFATGLHALKYDVEHIPGHVIMDDSRYEVIRQASPGNHVGIVRLYDLPESQEEVTLTIERPAMDHPAGTQDTVTHRDTLLHNAEMIGEETPVFFVESRGFLPGEKVKVSILSKEGKRNRRSRPVEFTPNPLMETHDDGASISASLTAMNPTMYMVKIVGINKGEKVRLVSVSGNERLDNPLTFRNDIYMNYMPGIIGEPGGESNLTVIRENGDKMSINIPWGDELLEHLKGNKSPSIDDFHFDKFKQKG